jgi:hypothetical protein
MRISVYLKNSLKIPSMLCISWLPWCKSDFFSYLLIHWIFLWLHAMEPWSPKNSFLKTFVGSQKICYALFSPAFNVKLHQHQILYFSISKRVGRHYFKKSRQFTDLSKQLPWPWYMQRCGLSFPWRSTCSSLPDYKQYRNFIRLWPIWGTDLSLPFWGMH